MTATYTDNGTNTPNGSHLEFTYTFPVLLSTDPVSRYFNFKKGDIIKIIRKYDIITYRIVK